MWIQNSQTRGIRMVIFVSKKTTGSISVFGFRLSRENSCHVDVSFQLGVCSQHTNKGLEFALCWLCAVSKLLKLSETYLPCFSVRGWDWLGTWSRVRVLEFPFFTKVVDSVVREIMSYQNKRILCIHSLGPEFFPIWCTCGPVCPTN